MTRVRGPRRGLSEFDEVDLEAQYVDVELQLVELEVQGVLVVLAELVLGVQDGAVKRGGFTKPVLKTTA